MWTRSRLFVPVESRPWLHQWTTILSETRLLGSLARAVSKGLRKSPPQNTQDKRPGLINLAVPKRIPSQTEQSTESTSRQLLEGFVNPGAFTVTCPIGSPKLRLDGHLSGPLIRRWLNASSMNELACHRHLTRLNAGAFRFSTKVMLA